MKTLQRSFALGEIAPEMAGLAGTTEYQTALAECNNFITLPHGPAMFRPGLSFHQMSQQKTAVGSRLIPFIFSDTDAFVLEVNVDFIRFHAAGGTEYKAAAETGVMDGYELAPDGVSPDLAANNLIYVSAGPDCMVGQWFFLQTGTGGNWSLRGGTEGTTFNADWEIANTVDGAPVTYHHAVQLTSPWGGADLETLHWTQSYDVLTVCCPAVAAQTIKRSGGTWSIAPVDLNEQTARAALFSVSVNSVTTTTVGTAPVYQQYMLTRVQSVNGVRVEEFASYVGATFDPSDGAAQFNFTASGAGINNDSAIGIYARLPSNEWAWLADAGSLPSGTPTDRSLLSYMRSQTGRTPENLSYPMTGFKFRAVGYHEQRKWFGGAASIPQTIYGLRTGSETSAAYTRPSAPDDAASFNLATLKMNQIEHIVSLSDLLVLTRSAVFRLTGGEQAISPTNVSVQARSYVGASPCQPAVVDDAVLYSAERGAHVHEIRYSYEQGGHVVNDLCKLAPHLIDGERIVSMAIQESPYRILWVVTANGGLRSLTYHPKSNAIAWHKHDVEGCLFKSVAVIPNGVEDKVFFSVRRWEPGTSFGHSRFQIETMDQILDRYFGDDRVKAVRLDGAMKYDGFGNDVSTVYNLWQLEGEEVSVVVDGGLQTPKTVENGRIDLDMPGSYVIVGKPYQGTIRTLPILVEVRGVGAYGLGHRKNVNEVLLRVHRSAGFFVGPNADDLVEAVPRFDELMGEPPELRTEDVSVPVSPAWTDETTVTVAVVDPFPFKVLSMAFDLEVSQ